MAAAYLLSIDQGTTSSRAAVYDETGQCLGSFARELTQHFPRPGWVEHDPEEIWTSVAVTVPRALEAAGIEAKRLTAIGLTNQRETALLWDRASGKAAARAVVWQDRRTTDFCRQHQAEQKWLHERTGLVLDPYFSATKVNWLLENVPGLRSHAEAGRLAFGTVDSFLIWRLTGGQVHATDATNASRTLLLNLAGSWDDDLCRFFSVPPALLPEVRPSAGDFGLTRGLDFLPDGIPIRGVAGDQQAALVGQGGFAAGDAKCTYGTGAFYLLHVGDRPVLSRSGLLTTLAATLDARPQYALEGSVFVAGAAVQWLRDGLRFIRQAPEIEELVAQSDARQPVLFVPAFVGLGAPYWVPEARGVLFGLTRATTAADLARAALQGVAYQVADLVDAADQDAAVPLHELNVDGGMARNRWFLQCQADLLARPVLQAPQSESTALGAAFLAGLAAGVWPGPADLRPLLQQARRFVPRLPQDECQRRRSTWRRAVETVIQFYTTK